MRKGESFMAGLLTGLTVFLLLALLASLANAQQTIITTDGRGRSSWVHRAPIRSNRPIKSYVEKPSEEQIQTLILQCADILERHEQELVMLRTWTSITGKKKQMPMTDFTPRTVTLISRGRERTVAITNLSFADQHFVRRLSAQRVLKTTHRRGITKVISLKSPYWFNKISTKLAAVQALLIVEENPQKPEPKPEVYDVEKQTIKDSRRFKAFNQQGDQ